MLNRSKSRPDDRQPPYPLRQHPATAHQDEDRGYACRHGSEDGRRQNDEQCEISVYPDDSKCHGQDRNVRGIVAHEVDDDGSHAGSPRNAPRRSNART